MIDRLVQDAIFFLTTLEPVGTLALFAGLTATMSDAQRRRTAHRAVGYSAVILLVSVLVGQLLLGAIGVRLLSLQVAGGLILFLIGLQMLFVGADATSEGDPVAGRDLAVFPLAVPSIAGPGAIMAAIVRTDNTLYDPLEQLATVAVLAGVLLLTWAALLLAGRILRVIGQTGATILVRVLGMLLASVSVELVLTALGVPGWA